MFKNPIRFDGKPSEIHTNSPVSLRRETTEGLLTEIALAGNVSATRLLSNLPAVKTWDAPWEILREREESHKNSLTD